MLLFVRFPSTSQNFSGWRGSLEIIRSEPSAKVGSPRASDTGTCPGKFGEKDTPQPPWAAYSSNIKKFYLMLRWNLLCFSSHPLLLILSLGSTESGLAPSWWPPAFETDRYALLGSPLTLLHSRLNFLKGISAQASTVCLPDSVPSLAVTVWGGFCAFLPSPCRPPPRAAAARPRSAPAILWALPALQAALSPAPAALGPQRELSRAELPYGT